MPTRDQLVNFFNFAQVMIINMHISAHFTLGVKAKIEKIFSILLINAGLYGLVLASRLKKG